MERRNVYLDHAAATLLDPRVREAMLPYLDTRFHNPQSGHARGYEVREALEAARAQVALLVGAPQRAIVFVSCGSEANNLAIKGVVAGWGGAKKRIVSSPIEHYSVLHPIKSLEKQGYPVTWVSVDAHGIITPEVLERAVWPDTGLVSIQTANPEIGTVQDIAALASVVKEKAPEAVFHTDAVDAAGTIPVHVDELHVDLLSLAPSTFYGPKGTAALYVRPGVRLLPLIEGGVQEEGRRAGLENVPAIVGFGVAAALARQEMEQRTRHLLPLRDRLLAELPKRVEYLYLSGHPTRRLPGNVHCMVEFVEGESLLLLLDDAGIAVSSGSACTSRALKASHVLQAVGADVAVAQGSLLFSLGASNTMADVEYVLEALPPVVAKLRTLSPLWAYFQKTGARQQAGPGAYGDDHHTDGGA